MKKRHDLFAAAGCFLSTRLAAALPVGAGILLLAGMAQIAAAQQQTSNTFVVVNNTGLPDDAVFLTFDSPVTGTGGTATKLASGTAYSLQQLKGTVSGAMDKGPVGNVPTFNLNTFSGRVYVALGYNMPMTTWPGTGDYNTVAGALELYVNPLDNDGHQNNGDISYVDYYSIPQNFKVKTLSGVEVPNIAQIVTTSGKTIGDILTNSTDITPLSARYQANYSVLNSSGTSVGKMTGLAQVLSAQHNKQYPGFGLFFTAMQSNSTSLTVKNYSTPIGPPTQANPKPGTLYGFGGVPLLNQTVGNPFVPNGTPASRPPSPPSRPSWENDRSEAWYQLQDYSLSAMYVSDLTSGLPLAAVARLNQQGIKPGTPGLRMFTNTYTTGTTNNGTSSSVGDFGIYITETQLKSGDATYGANPEYILDWGGAATVASGTSGTAAQIVKTTGWNSLSDRVVGDFMAAMTYGWGLAGTTASGQSLPLSVYQHATNTKTTEALTGTIFDTVENSTGPGASPITDLWTGQFFYLVDLQTGKGNIQDWTGSGIQPFMDTWYDTYGSFQPKTNAYAFPYGDRLQMNSPDIYWWPGGSTVDPSTLYMEWTLNPGSYVFTPSAGLLSAGKAQNYSVKFRPKGKVLKDGYTTKQLGKAPTTNKAGVNSSFIITNTGKKPLTGLKITKDGAAAADFTITGLNKKPLPPGKSITVNVTFRPKTEGNKQAFLHITSNESLDNPFDLTLIGTGMRAKKPR